MPGQSQYQATGVMGVSCNGPCWKYTWQGDGKFKHVCNDQVETEPCTAVIRFTNGDKVKYTFACDANPASAGYVQNDGTYVWAVNWTLEEWL